MKVGFCARGEKGLRLLEGLVERDFEIPFVFTCEHTPEVGGSPEAFEQVAEREGIPFEFVDDINTDEYKRKLDDFAPDLVVSLLWRDIVSEEVFDRVEHGFLNQHAGRLPRYRGNAARNWAILEGEDEMGITTHQMTEKIDAGPILAQDTVPIEDDTTVRELTEASREIGVEQLLRVLAQYRNGSPPVPIPQNEGDAMRAYPRIPEYGQIDWDRGVAEIERLVRSLGGPYPNAFTYHDLEKVEVTDAAVVSPDRYPTPEFLAEPGHIVRITDDDTVWVAAGDGIVELREVVAGRDDGPKKPGELFGSIRDRFGTDVERELRELRDRVAELEGELER